MSVSANLPVPRPETDSVSAGQSGNPGGRSKAQVDVINAARQHTQEAIDTLVLVMRNGKPGEAAMAANSLLDRGWGRPKDPEAMLDMLRRRNEEQEAVEALKARVVRDREAGTEPWLSGNDRVAGEA
jgi:hypothetical protein